MGQRLKEIRKDLGYTQKEFASKLNISQQNLSRYENGELAVSLHIITTLYEIGYDTNWLLYEKGYVKRTENESAKEKVGELEKEIVSLKKRVHEIESEKEKLSKELIQRLAEIVELQRKLGNNKREK
jgi:transcriptional regulator with XRE-family HTH domain